MRLDAKTTAALALPASKVDVIHFDSALPGFGYRLRQGAGGRVLRSWVAQYRRAGGTRRVLLGSADVLTAEMARQAAKKLLAKVALGEDPQGDRADRRQKDRISLRSVIDEYLLAKKTELRPRSLCEVMRYLTGPYLKSLHAMPIDTVSRKDVAAQLVAISRERHRGTGACSTKRVLCLGHANGYRNKQSSTRHPASGRG
jgi:hypothetical protein